MLSNGVLFLTFINRLVFVYKVIYFPYNKPKCYCNFIDLETYNKPDHLDNVYFITM